MYRYIQKHLINLRLTTNEVGIEDLGKATIIEQKKIFKDAKSNKIISEFFLLQKCNCVELYFVVNNNSQRTIDSLIKFWVNHSISLTLTLQSKISKTEDFQAALHLIKVATSLESLLLGDAQVLGQVRQARKIANEEKTPGPVLNLLLKYANIAGSRTRTETKLCSGNVSVPRVTFNIVMDLFSKGKGKILIVGAGRMGKLITELLAGKIPRRYLFVTNRTQDKADSIASKENIGIQEFTSYKGDLKKFRYIVFTVDTPYYLLSKKDAQKYLANQKVTLIDISNPPCVDPKISINKDITVLNLDYIQTIGTKNLTKRRQEIIKVSKIVKEEFNKFKQAIMSLGVEELITRIYTDACRRGMKYTERLNKKSNPSNSKDKSSLDYLVQGLISRSLIPVTKIRTLAVKDFSRAKSLAIFLASTDE